MPPVRAGYPSPPVGVVAQINALVRLMKNRGARREWLRSRIRVVRTVWRPLCNSDVTGCLDELAEGGIRHEVTVDPEAFDRHVVRRRLFWVVVVRSHAEHTPANPEHSLGGRLQ